MSAPHIFFGSSSSNHALAMHNAISATSASAELCESDRLVLFEHYVEARTIEEIAARLRVVPTIVRQQLNRALRGIQQALSFELALMRRRPQRS
jgi:DNA-directed RNA polymerase specialized sigma24 family protein